MTIMNLNLQQITDRPELSRWLIERLEETGPFLAITEEANRHCDHFIRTLLEYEPVTFVPITKNSVRRMKSTRTEPFYRTIPRTAQRSVALLEFLGTLGSFIDDCDETATLPWCDVVAFALVAWTDREKYLVFQNLGDFQAWRVVGTASGTLKFNALIDVHFNPEIYNPYSDQKFWESAGDEADDDGSGDGSDLLAKLRSAGYITTTE